MCDGVGLRPSDGVASSARQVGVRSLVNGCYDLPEMRRRTWPVRAHAGIQNPVTQSITDLSETECCLLSHPGATISGLLLKNSARSRVRLFAERIYSVPIDVCVACELE